MSTTQATKAGHYLRELACEDAPNGIRCLL